MKAANDHVSFGSGNVLKDLDIVMTREEWAALCRRNGSSLPYPYADVAALSRTRGEKDE